jgi:membrane protein implicated in regulation of membrane protease activity
MNTLRILKQLLLGETWIVPLGLALTVAAGGVFRALGASHWPQLGGFIMLAAVLLILLASVNRSARRRS